MTQPSTSRPRLVPPALAARVPSVARLRTSALIIGALVAVTIIVQAVALATAIDRSLLHHVALRSVRTELIVVVIALVARAALTSVGEATARRQADVVTRSLRSQLLVQVMALGPSWLAGERPGELSLTATRGLRSLHTYFARYVPQAAMAAIVPVVLLAWVATQDWLAFVVVIALVIAVPVTMIYFGREANRRTQRQWRRLGSLSGRFLQLIEGLPTLRAFGRDAQGRREVAESSEGVRIATMSTLRVAFLSALSMDMIAGFGVGFVAMVLGLRLLWGELQLETAMAVLLVAPEIFIPLRRAGAEFHASTEGQAAAARILEVLDQPATTPDMASIATNDAVPLGSTGNDNDLRIEGLCVRYAGRSGGALEDFDLFAPAGARLALVGPSGAGKSTVLAALLGFAERNAGAISVGALSIASCPIAQWRTCFSWMPQRPHLFSATMAENLRLGAPDASDAELHAVLGAVGLGRLIEHLPASLATALGHDGITLSAGERQRVALARALLRPASILLLDEPTASLDPATGADIAAAIEPYLAGRTVIVVAHEPVLLPHFDSVVHLAATHRQVALS